MKDEQNKLEKWIAVAEDAERDKKALYESVKNFATSDAIVTDKAIKTMELLNAEIRKANGIIKRLTKHEKDSDLINRCWPLGLQSFNSLCPGRSDLSRASTRGGSSS